MLRRPAVAGGEAGRPGSACRGAAPPRRRSPPACRAARDTVVPVFGIVRPVSAGHHGVAVDVGGLALVGRHAERGVALEMLDRAEAFAVRERHVLGGDVVLQVDEGFALRDSATCQSGATPSARRRRRRRSAAARPKPADRAASAPACAPVAQAAASENAPPAAPATPSRAAARRARRPRCSSDQRGLRAEVGRQGRRSDSSRRTPRAYRTASCSIRPVARRGHRSAARRARRRGVRPRARREARARRLLRRSAATASATSRARIDDRCHVHAGGGEIGGGRPAIVASW